jgi:hypothetical protein
MASPEPGSVQYLEDELERMRQAVIAAKDAEYLLSPQLIKDIKHMQTRIPKPYGGQKPETMQEIVKAFIEEYARVSSAYSTALWEK